MCYDYSNSVKHLDDYTFNDYIENDAVLVLFVRDDCKLGRKQLTTLKHIAFMYPELFIASYNSSHHVEQAITYEVFSTPTFLFFRRGRLKDRVHGFKEEDELLALFCSWIGE